MKRLIGLACLLALPGLAGAQFWTATGAMAGGREGGTATLLLSGEVLVAGGKLTTATSNRSATLTAELYDPATGTWRQTGPTSVVHLGGSAIQLPGGEVLLAGGIDAAYRHTNVSEIYDPVTETWSQTGGMLGGGLKWSALTLLPNGKVLATGRDSTGGSCPQVYDPETRTWTLTGPMNVNIGAPTATRLNSGLVLIAGGAPASNRAELFDWRTNSFTSIASMTKYRSGQTATLLESGKVLVAGGDSSMSTAELYDPITSTWTSGGLLNECRTGGHAATKLENGKVLVSGTGCVSAPSAEVYDPATNVWTRTGSMITARSGLSLIRLPSAKVLAVGGENVGADPFIPTLRIPSATELYTQAQCQ